MVKLPVAPTGPEQVSIYYDLPDHAAEADDRALPIDKVGIKRLRYPIQVRDKVGKLQSTVADVAMYVGLPADVKGTHMSRFIEVLNARRGEVTLSNLPEILSEVQRRLEADDAYVDLNFPYFIEKAAPVSGARSLMEYSCGFRARKVGPRFEFTLLVGVPITSLCPCSKAVSKYGAHNQRSEVTVEIQSSDFVWIEDVVAAVEGCASAPLYALLKREDEKFVTEQAYENPRFVEDLVREILLAVRFESVTEATVRAENFESIHNHSAYAEISWSEEQEPAQLGLALGITTGDDRPFGEWFRDLRESRGFSQSSLADKLGCSTSFLSRVEAGTKRPSEALLGSAAELLGQEPDKLTLRAGIVPEKFSELIRRDPERFLSWVAQA